MAYLSDLDIADISIIRPSLISANGTAVSSLPPHGLGCIPRPARLQMWTMDGSQTGFILQSVSGNMVLGTAT